MNATVGFLLAANAISRKLQSCAAIMALKDANERNGAVVPALATLSKSFRMDGLIYLTDTPGEVSQKEAVRGYRSARENDAVAIVGCRQSADSEPTALLSAVDATPQISPWSSATELANDRLFDTFSRTIPSDQISARLLATMVSGREYFAWGSVAVLHARDAYGNGYYRQMLGATSDPDGGRNSCEAGGANTRVLSYYFDSQSGDDASLNRTILDLKQSGETAIVVVVGTSPGYVRVVQLLHAAGMVTPDYAYILVDARAEFESVNLSPTEKKVFQGMLVWNSDPTRNSSGYAALSARWNSTGASDCYNAAFNPPDSSFFADAPSVNSAYAYDAVSAVAIALNGTNGSGGYPLLSQLRSASFDGASGAVSFNIYNGDRAASTIEYNLGNFVPNQEDQSNPVYIRTVGWAKLNTSAGFQDAESVQVVRLSGIDWIPDSEGQYATTVGKEGEEGWPLRPRPDSKLPCDDDLHHTTGEIPEFVYAATIGAFVGILLLWLCWVYLGRYIRRQRTLRLEAHAYEAEQEQLVTKALELGRELQFASVTISALDFLELGRLRPHEELRDRPGVLRHVDLLSQLEQSSDRIIFFSHQWTSFTEPDHSGEQFRCMVRAVRAIAEAKGWRLESTRIWCDFFSIPQRCKGMQLLAINSLAAYAASAHAFAVVAPKVVHADTNQTLDLESYNRRMWCRLENLCHWLHCGSNNRWLMEGSECVPAPDDDAFINTNLRVFQGEATVEADKLTLVLPLLSLYAEIYARRLCQQRAAASASSRAGPEPKRREARRRRVTTPTDGNRTSLPPGPAEAAAAAAPAAPSPGTCTYDAAREDTSRWSHAESRAESDGRKSRESASSFTCSSSGMAATEGSYVLRMDEVGLDEALREHMDTRVDQVLQEHMDEIFPRRIQIRRKRVARPQEVRLADILLPSSSVGGKRAAQASSTSKTGVQSEQSQSQSVKRERSGEDEEEIVEEIQLFGDLCQRLEKRLASSTELQDRLVRSVERHFECMRSTRAERA